MILTDLPPEILFHISRFVPYEFRCISKKLFYIVERSYVPYSDQLKNILSVKAFDFVKNYLNLSKYKSSILFPSSFTIYKWCHTQARCSSQDSELDPKRLTLLWIHNIKKENNIAKQFVNAVFHIYNIEKILLNNNEPMINAVKIHKSIDKLPLIYNLKIDLKSPYQPPLSGRVMKYAFPSLKSLKLNDINLKIIPREISAIRSLEELDVSMNALIELPDEIGELGSLRILDCRVNRLKSLPKTLINLRSLIKLQLRGNPLPKDAIPQALIPKSDLL